MSSENNRLWSRFAPKYVERVFEPEILLFRIRIAMNSFHNCFSSFMHQAAKLQRCCLETRLIFYIPSNELIITRLLKYGKRHVVMKDLAGILGPIRNGEIF